jgi:hypothetical protein
MQLLGSIEPIYPQAKDNVDPDALVREFNDLLGNPQKILFGPDDVAKQRAQTAQMAQQQQQMNSMSQMAEAAGKAAPAGKVLQDLPTQGGGNALGALLGGQQK